MQAVVCNRGSTARRSRALLTQQEGIRHAHTAALDLEHDLPGAQFVSRSASPPPEPRSSRPPVGSRRAGHIKSNSSCRPTSSTPAAGNERDSARAGTAAKVLQCQNDKLKLCFSDTSVWQTASCAGLCDVSWPGFAELSRQSRKHRSWTLACRPQFVADSK